MKLNRREFLTAATAAAFSLSQSIRAQNRDKILVLGAGLSGLSAAYELSRCGYAVTILEARNRAGGRIKTLREPFRDGQFVELGGELIGNGYKRMMNYVRDFGVPFEEVPERFETSGSVSSLQFGTGTTAVMKGKLYPIGSVLDPHPYGLTGDEAKGLPNVILSVHLRAMAAEIRQSPERLLEYDRISLANALRKRGVSDSAIRLMDVALNYNSIEVVSAGGALFDLRRRMTAGTGANRIVGGNDVLISAFRKKIEEAGVKIVLNARVRKIGQSKRGVSATYSIGRRSVVAEADHLVCTIPFAALRDVTFDPALPPEKARAIREIQYTRVTKVYMQGKRFEWDRRNVGTSVWTDTPLERIFEMAGERGDERGIFTAWMDGNGAAVSENMTDAARQVWARSSLAEILPFMKGAIERTATKSWTNDPFARGSYAHYAVGQFAALQPNVKSAVGNIHFAGEHTAETAPGMEGALESAERVVREIAGEQSLLRMPERRQTV